MNNPFSDPEGKVDQWLQDRGFKRGNPFKKTAADDERDLLTEELFVPVGDYELIGSNQTVLVFAPRGGGKSALRIRLAAQALPQNPEALTLAVEITDFGWLVARYRETGRVTEGDYTNLLLRQTAVALLKTFIPSSDNQTTELAEREKRAGEVSFEARAQMAALIKRYAPARLAPAALFTAMRRLWPAFDGNWYDFEAAAGEQTLRSYLSKTNVAPKRHAAWLLADLNDQPAPTTDPYESPLEPFKSLTRLAALLQIDHVHFLVDRLDEMQLFADNYEAQADILEPLLAYLNLLELPGLAFKFFVARELYRVLQGRTAVRRDRLLNKAVTLHWTEDDLDNLLENRLNYFSQEAISSLAQVCAENDTRIQADLRRTAMGSPRRLLTGGYLLVQAHVHEMDGQGLLSWKSWQQAKRKLLQIMPPTLQLRLNERLAVKAGEAIKLTKTEVKILSTLVGHDGHCTRTQLKIEVWGADEGVTDDAVEQAFRRLRDKIEVGADTAVYLHMLRGAQPGFRLENFEASD